MSMGFNLTNAFPFTGATARNTVNWNADDTLNWLKGDHSMKFGFSFTRITNWNEARRIAPGVTLGLTTAMTNDPAIVAGIFNTTNFPTATTTDLANAMALYGLLTGRVATLPGTGQLNNQGTQYIFNGLNRDAERQDEYGMYAQDSWRWKPNVTVTAGVRYVLQMPLVATVGRLTGSGLADACGISGQATDIARHAQEIIKIKRRLNEIYARHTGQGVDVIEKALDRDYFLTAEEAKTFGLVDQVMAKRPSALDPSRGE